MEDPAWWWVYTLRVAQPQVPTEAIDARLDELRGAVRDFGQSPSSLFGDPSALAAADVAELGTPEEVLRTEGVAGGRVALTRVGIGLVLFGPLALVFLLFSTGWSAALPSKMVVAAVGLMTFGVGLALARIFYFAARPVAMAVSLLLGLAGFAGGAVFVGLSRGTGWWPSEFPTLLAALVVLLPGVTTLLVAGLVPERDLRTEWGETEWWRRFRGALVLRGMPVWRVREQEREVRLALDEAGVSGADAEYGNPIVFARRLAADDRSARAVRWAWGGVGALTIPVAVAISTVAADPWRMRDVVFLAVAVVLIVAVSLARWRSRPWRAER